MNTENNNSLDYSDNANTDSIPERIKNWYRGLPDKKRYLEFVTALLTIPVLLTVLLSNVSNLQTGKKSEPTPTTAQPTSSITFVLPTEQTNIATPTMEQTNTQCTPHVGLIGIEYPEEKSTIVKDPVCLDIVRESGNYCSVVWSYRINGSSWSDYTDRSICMYGLASGDKLLELRVKSIVGGEEKILKRNFTVGGLDTPTPATQSGAM